jgi:hypothetical protein
MGQGGIGLTHWIRTHSDPPARGLKILVSGCRRKYPRAGKYLYKRAESSFLIAQKRALPASSRFTSHRAASDIRSLTALHSLCHTVHTHQEWPPRPGNRAGDATVLERVNRSMCGTNGPKRSLRMINRPRCLGGFLFQAPDTSKSITRGYIDANTTSGVIGFD